MSNTIKVSIALVAVYLLVWAGVLGLPFSDFDKNKVDLWVSYLIFTEEVLSLICLVFIGQLLLKDVKSSLLKTGK
ncbi:hypothetical protein KP803_10290 [Vibrio sp. ZSDE26]|uniref:Uncharacterized protein n=1 Tax=Vibrio amylolyticus TaxID=2847292 RepID=A0A9X2BH71_9VIBR|nr:hypothetical protein [Vibrio amylolyticus]MCK6263661.1 hypothetical protein [Vibrio amylolyticus]